MNRLHHFFLLVLLFCVVACSSQRGKPDLKPYKAETKKAKKGDFASMLLLAQVNQGYFFTSPSQRDFKSAEKWLKKASETAEASLSDDFAMTAFKLYWIGGYGISQNRDKAAQYLQKVQNKSLLAKRYFHKEDIHLQNLPIYYQNYRGGSAAEQVKLARLLLEFEIDYDEATQILNEAIAKGNADARYLHAKWQYIRSRDSKEVGRRDEHISPNFLSDMRNFAQEGSALAAAEYLHFSQVHNNHRDAITKADKAELIVALFRDKDDLSSEQKFKLEYLLLPKKQGREVVFALRKIGELLPAEADTEVYAFAKADMDKLQYIENQLKTIEGMAGLWQEHKEWGDFPVAIAEYKQAFQGDIQPLTKLYYWLKESENERLIREENVSRAQEEILNKVPQVFSKVNDASELYSFKQAMEREQIYSRVRQSYLNGPIEERMEMLALSAADLQIEYEKQRLDEQTFKSFYEGRQALGRVQSNSSLSPTHRSRLARLVKQKTIRDIYGTNPTKRQINHLEEQLRGAAAWLQPEGYDMFFEYKRNSNNWFAGNVNRHGTLYKYEVIRKGDTDEFELEIKSVKNNQSNLAYKSTISLERKEGQEYVIDVYGAKRKSYMWIPSKSDYLRVVAPERSSLIETPISKGQMEKYRNSQHGHASDSLLRKEDPNDNSHKSAIRAAVKYFILEYAGALSY
ncbi:MAG: sel1 repeat family protein [Bernardetiaceae bacterium]|nr:sel1 repeat family protein [Bernardetiaceae bacterium]